MALTEAAVHHILEAHGEMEPRLDAVLRAVERPTSYRVDGNLVGITLLSPRWLLEHDGEIVLTLPERTIRATDLGPVLAAA